MEMQEILAGRTKLSVWQERLAKSNAEYAEEAEKMNERDRLYKGKRELRPLVPGDTKINGERKQTSHVRNIVFENLESMVSSTIPAPKVTPRRKKDEHLAAVIEHWLRNELDRLPFELMNDMAERTVPLQGGAFWLVEWDNERRTHDTVGEIAVTLLHPKQAAPQPGVFTGVEDMDWFIVKSPTTKGAIRREFGKDVFDQAEQEPELRDSGGTGAEEELVTKYLGYERNEHGGIDRFVWVNDVVLEELEDYQGRHSGGETLETEKVYAPISTQSGTKIPGAVVETDGDGLPVLDEDGMPVLLPTEIPFYRPDVMPVVLQRNVSVYGQLLGNSDADAISDQQNTVNRLEQKILDRLIKAGTRITMPPVSHLRVDTEDQALWHMENLQDLQFIRELNFTGDISPELTFLGNSYEEARQVLGITDSFQGRRDSTATSGTAKEFAAAQSAGRLESKRVMKAAAYAQLFELMFKFALAYSDEPRPVVYKDHRGDTVYEEFNRYDFLEQDAAGVWFWNDQFLFSVDTNAALENNRAAMWQETRMNLQTGAFGNPQQTETLILFWGKMEELHYPGAATTKKFLEERLEREQAAAQMAMQAQASAPYRETRDAGGGIPYGEETGIPAGMPLS